MTKSFRNAVAWLAFCLGIGFVSDAKAAPRPNRPGFLVAAPDRGFLGNEEFRDSFERFAKGERAELLIVSDSEVYTGERFERALEALKKKGAKQVVILPFFMSTADSRYKRLARLVETRGPSTAKFSSVFGQSYLAVERLADAFRGMHHTQGINVVVFGHGATDQATRAIMERELLSLTQKAAKGFGFASTKALVLFDGPSMEDDARAKEEKERIHSQAEGTVLVPFHLGAKLDSMMTLSGFVTGSLLKGSTVAEGDITPSELVFTWLRREANRFADTPSNETGVIILAHGSEFEWNQTMQDALKPLEKKYKVEYSFSMADQPVLQRAVSRLEARGAKSVVIVRIFGLGSSFRTTVDEMFGLSLDGHALEPSSGTQATTSHHHTGHGDGHGHGSSHGQAVPSPRIRTPILMASVGGLDDHDLFADALLDRARGLSRDPSKDTVILVAHGSGQDADNDRWLGVLESMAAKMKRSSNFREIKVATWREDWPEKREPWVSRVRQFVEDASKEEGRAIVIPARTNAEGFEKRFLKGLKYELGSGFAPHPLFLKWVDEQVEAGRHQLQTM